MGNNLDITKSCMTTAQLCTQSQQLVQAKNSSIIIKKNTPTKSTEQIKQKIIKFAQQNKLQLYSTRQRKVFQALVSVNQQHVGQYILGLDSKIKKLQQQRKEFKWQKQRQKKKKAQIIQNQKTKSNDSQSQQKQNCKKLQNIVFSTKNEQFQHQKLLSQLIYKRKKMFQQSQCLLLEDLDMLFGQIDRFDQNREVISNILSKTQGFFHNKSNLIDQNTSKIRTSELINNHQFQIKLKVDQQIHTGRPNLIKNQNKNQNNHNIKKQQNKSSQQYQGPPQSKKLIQLQKKQKHNFSAIIQKNQNKANKRENKNGNTHQQHNLRQIIKIEDKKLLKKNHSLVGLGSNVLKNHQLLIIVPIQCFSGIGVLANNSNTGLPSKTSLLQLFVKKVKAVNKRRNCVIGLCFLVNQNSFQLFKQQINQVKGLQNVDNTIKGQNDSALSNHVSDSQYDYPIRYNVVQFKNSWPSFNQQQKISINEMENQINFCHENGDLITFIENSLQLKSLIQKYKYVNFTNLNNMLTQIGDSTVLGYLEENQKIDIVVKILKPHNDQFQLSQFFKADKKGFVQIIKQLKAQDNKQNASNQLVYGKNKSFLNIQDYYIRSRIFIAQSGPLKRLLLSRICRQIDPNMDLLKVNFFLKRDISDILYNKFTTFLTVEQQYEFSYVKELYRQKQNHFKYFSSQIVKNGEIGYSRYCKKILGIKNSQADKQIDQLVQIDAGILHKSSDQLILLSKKVESIQQIGFPIILYSDNAFTQRSNVG